jgi:hypothetical protein
MSYSVTKTQPIPRAFKDLQLIETKALPAAAANNSTDAIDLQQTVVGVNLDDVDVELSVPATPALVDDKTITFTFQDSANGTNFDPIAGLATVVTTGAASAGAAAVKRIVKLPPSTRQYIRVNAAVLTAGGDNTAVSYSLALLF